MICKQWWNYIGHSLHSWVYLIGKMWRFSCVKDYHVFSRHRRGIKEKSLSWRVVRRRRREIFTFVGFCLQALTPFWIWGRHCSLPLYSNFAQSCCSYFPLLRTLSPRYCWLSGGRGRATEFSILIAIFNSESSWFNWCFNCAQLR